MEDFKTKFNSIIAKTPIAVISEKLNVSQINACRLKKGDSVRVRSDKLIEFLSNYNSDTIKL